MRVLVLGREEETGVRRGLGRCRSGNANQKHDTEDESPDSTTGA